MKLVPRFVGSIFIFGAISLILFLSKNLNDFTRCKVVVENDDLLLRAGMMNGKDASRMSTPVSATETILPPTKNLSVEEIETLKKAMANKTVSRKTFFNKRTRVKHLPLPSTSDERNVSQTPWTSFKRQISNIELYSETMQGSQIDELLDRMAALPIVRIREKSGGTQLKLVLTLSDGTKTIFKPMRFNRQQETLPDHFYFSDYERHNAEIAAFHLDRILEFRRCPPTAGRIVNVSYELERLAEGDFRKTFFVSPAGNVCFHGHCSYYCDTSHAVCGHPYLMESSIAVYLPSTDEADRETFKHPWSRSYSKRKRAKWQDDPNYCKNKTLISRSGRRLNDLVDMAIFDFLTGNLDRHHYELFTEFGDNGYPLNLDNGRAFGRSRWDEISILAPLYQCCRIRRSTLEKLLHVTQADNLLSDWMRESLANDRLPPLLTEPHLLALDRRAFTVLRSVLDCLANSGLHDVIIDDGF